MTRGEKENQPAPKRAADLAEVAFERLRRAILTGELGEGERVRETRLAAEWKIGVTPLREAVRRMAAMGYLVLKPNHAPVVRQLSARDVSQIYEIREVLECMALQACWETIRTEQIAALEKLVEKVDAAKTKESRLRRQFALDAELHALWSASPENPWLSSSLERLIIYRPNMTSVMARHAQYVEEAFGQHKQILQAIKERDFRAAQQHLIEHIRHSGATLVAVTTN